MSQSFTGFRVVDYWSRYVLVEFYIEDDGLENPVESYAVLEWDLQNPFSSVVILSRREAFSLLVNRLETRNQALREMVKALP